MGGGVITILQSPRGVITILQSLGGGGGYYNITGPLGEGGKENQANFI